MGATLSLAFKLGGWVVLICSLALIPALPEVATTVTIIAMILGIGFLVVDLRGGMRLSAAQWLVLAGTALFALALVPTTRSAGNFFVLLAVAPVALSIPLAALLARLGDRLTLNAVASLALVGAALAAAITAYDVYVRDVRGGYLTMNPIHMGDIAVTLGLLSGAAALDGRKRWRLVFLLGPILALLAVWWSSSRGPLVTMLGLAGLSAIFLLVLLVPRKWRLPGLVGGAALCLIVAAHGLYSGWLGNVPGIDQLLNIMQGNDTDGSTRIRMALYEGGWKAFLASPIYGHGGEAFIATASSFVERDLMKWDHLHSDLADFAAIAGIAGLIAYLLFLAAPLAEALRRGPRNPALLYLGLLLPAAYFGMGLTNAVFGILTLTVLYGVVLAVLHNVRMENPATG